MPVFPLLEISGSFSEACASNSRSSLEGRVVSSSSIGQMLLESEMAARAGFSSKPEAGLGPLASLGSVAENTTAKLASAVQFEVDTRSVHARAC